MFSGSADKMICVWKREGITHTCLSMLTGHAGPVKWKVYSGSLDKSVKVWTVSEQAPDMQQMALMSNGNGLYLVTHNPRPLLRILVGPWYVYVLYANFNIYSPRNQT